MSYTLRFHQGTNTLNGWDVSAKYNNKAIADIKDPSGGAASLPITSVPTPFATFELVRNAYEQVLAILKKPPFETLYNLALALPFLA